MQDGGLAGVSVCCLRVTSVRVGTSGLLVFILLLRAQPSTLQTGEVMQDFRLCSLQRIKKPTPTPQKRNKRAQQCQPAAGGLGMHL